MTETMHLSTERRNGLPSARGGSGVEARLIPTLGSRRSITTLLLLTLALGLVAFKPGRVAHAGDDAPSWLRQAAASQAPSYDKNVPAVVLLDEESVRVEEDGRVTTIERGAMRILTREGRGYAAAATTYTPDTGKVREMRAWVIRPSGQVKKFGKDEIVDVAVAPNDVYDEARRKVVFAEDDVEPGAVFGYESISEDRSVFTQFEWLFQTRLPSLVSRFILSLPEGWRAESVTFNHAKIEPVVNGAMYLWELRDLPFITEEPASPAVTNIAPRVAVSFFPAPTAKTVPGRSFDNWTAVSRWLAELSDGQAVLDDALASKARQLTANAKTEYERIQAIGRYVQAVNYVSIQTGIGRGGGYRPHSAIEVFTKSYGDCKDKANLMRAMLKAVNIPAYLVSIYSGDPMYVREEWPSPQQFNHCIIAVKVSDETEVPTVVKHPALGRLMIFDPTDDNTPVGDLPGDEQGSLALIVAGDQGSLLRMPVTPPEANRLERQSEVMLGPDGSISATVRDRALGQSAVALRRVFRRLARPDFVKFIERWVTSGATGANVSKVEPADNAADGRFSLDVEFTAARYGQLMQGRLLVFKPAVVSRREFLFLTDATREHPVVLGPHAYAETVRIKLPDGFAVDELPDPAKLDTPFGTYSTSYEVKDGRLTFTRSLLVRGGTIPVAQYASVRSFFEKIRAAEQAPVLLARK
ncbi:MAG TPA: DUF3857 domain-containing protein [Blastocatellia bacterium]|nr:DUF3857 domain-containing protein [Blastocatellia bacterium]